MNEDKNVILTYEQQTLNNFIIFQEKYFNKIGDKEYDAFKRKYSENLFVVPILFGIFLSLHLLFHKSNSTNEIIFSVALLILFIICLVITIKDVDNTLKNLYNVSAYQRVIELIKIAKDNEITEHRATIDYAEYCRISNKYSNITDFFKDNYLTTPLYRNISITTSVEKKHIDLINSSLITKGYCMCCGEYGAKKLSNKRNDFLLCDLCFEEEFTTLKECE